MDQRMSSREAIFFSHARERRSPDAARGPACLRVAMLVAMLVGCLSMLPASAFASTTQEAMFQDDPGMLTNPSATLERLRILGVDRVRVAIRWMKIAPNANSHRRPRRFNAADPASYPARNWAIYDKIDKLATADGITINWNVVGGAPIWATGSGAPKGRLFPDWEPSAVEFGRFMQALGKRYGGSFNPKTKRLAPGNPADLPHVGFWSIWNEPDYGPSLSPQGLPGDLRVEHSPEMYRGLLDAAWGALHRTGHGRDTILFGEVAPRGFPTAQHPTYSWGVFSGMKPLTFLRALYCVNSSYRPLRGNAASLRGCPSTAGGSRAFRSNHPALFEATGFADHPYSRWWPPNVERPNDPDYSSLADIGGLERSLDRLQRAYGSGRKLPIWNTEYGYLTDPPKRSTAAVPDVSPATAALYLNWAEYISYRDPRIRSFMQYLLKDPLPALSANDFGGFASGLLNYGGAPKATYNAWRLPLYLPVLSGHIGRALEVWGAVRPIHFALLDSPLDPESVQIQFAPGTSSTYSTLATVQINDPHGYFDTRVAFPRSGTVRLTWTYPSADPLLAAGYQVYSRHQPIVLHR
ncbi:MAG: hypothetical protein ACYC91_13760 [Solirubrobacteraceae bacterium]